MYCPKCGGQNSDDLAYCRECGENLKIISQVMKGHTPLAIVSKLDAALDQTEERFRKDAILWTFWGVAILANNLIRDYINGLPIAEVLISSVLFPTILLMKGVWDFLLYRRSRELRLARLRGASTEADTDGLTSFCVACGAPNFNHVETCIKCGVSTSGHGTRSLLSRILTSQYASLDASIARSDRVGPSYTTFRWLFISKILFLLVAVLFFTQGNWIGAVFVTLLMASRIVSQTWDLINYRRAKALEPPVDHEAHPERFESLDHGDFFNQLRDEPVPDEIYWDEKDLRATDWLLTNSEATTKPLADKSLQKERLATNKLQNKPD